MHAIKIFSHGLVTGLILQLAVGPIFFIIVNLALQGSIYNGLSGALAVAVVDCIYIALAVFGVGQLLQYQKVKRIFGIVSSMVLILFGAIILKNVIDTQSLSTLNAVSENPFASFLSVFALTITNPMTIVFFTSLFTTKALEYRLKKKELLVFGFGTGFATFLFMGMSVVIFSFIKEGIPMLLIQILNILVACLLIAYGGVRFVREILAQSSN